METSGYTPDDFNGLLYGTTEIDERLARWLAGTTGIPESFWLASEKTYKPGIEIVSASVQPARVSAGDAIKLLIQYRVNGVPPGFSFEVKESHQLRVNDATIGQVEESISRGAGTFTSAKTINVPPNAAPDFYTFRAQVTLAGVEAEALAFFEVKGS